ncbi:MAG: hypothetical protein GY795_09765 [Desulfobacterales bacterium]|nr:hypothetical protein [Desulfobacterales bacterium]
MENKFEKAVELVQQTGYEDISDRLHKELDAMNADTYKITVVGEFKAGKSTLINQVFLKDNALFTDIMEATAVPTEIHFGREKLLKVIPYTITTYKETNPFDESLTAVIEVSEGEGKPVEISNPSGEDIKNQTSADTPEKRAHLARKISRVQLYWPANNLTGLTVFDTPGINSINEAVIATTYRIIPETDLVLFITNAKQLSSIEMEFLSSRVFSEGIARAITVVTYNPKAGLLSGKQRKSLLNSIRSQLANIGRDNVPVEMVALREHSGDTVKPGLSFKNRVDAGTADTQAGENVSQVINDVISNLLGEQQPTAPQSPEKKTNDEDISVAALEEKLIQYIRDNVRPGRIEKASQVLKMQVQLALVRCSAELAAMNKTEDERRQMLDDIKTRETEMREKYKELSGEFRDELRLIQTRFTVDVENGLDKIADSYIAGFSACNGLGELQNRLKNAEVILKRDMEEMFLGCSQRAREQIKALIEKYGVKSQVLLNPWQAEISQELAIDGGILSRIPPFAVLAIDMLLFVQFGPFGPLADILIRLLANYIPYINKVMPVAIAGHLLKASVRNSLKKQFETIKEELPAGIENSFREVGDKLLLEWKEYADEQLDTVRKSVEKTVDQPVDLQRRDVLIKVKMKLESIFAEL